MLRTKRSSAWIAAFTACTLVAGACGSDDDGGDGATDGSAAVTIVDDTTAAGGSEPVGTGDGTDTTDAGDATDDANRNVEDEGEPVKGGTLVYGLDADTGTPWAHYRAGYASPGYILLQSVSDSLFAVTDEGEIVGLLVESWEANADFTEYTLHIRDGISFHDGTPLDGEAVKFNIDACRYSPLTATAYAAIDTVTANGQDVVITTAGGPWVALPSRLSYASCGYMLSKEWLSSLEDVPQRNAESPGYDATLAATPANGDPAAPIGVGAFRFESYTPGNGNSYKAVRNEDYWRGPNGITGEDLPHLDAVEGVVYVDVDSRSNAVRTGDVDVMHTANSDSVRQFIDDGSLEVITSDRYGETGYIMLNVAEGPESDPEGANADSPLLTRPCRQALAAAIDSERWAEERGGAIESAANGPFSPGSLGYLEDTGYPTYDPAAAAAYMDECLAERGTDSIEFTFNTTNDPFNVESNQLVQSMWAEAFGDKVQSEVTPIEQGQYIGLALNGTFQAFGWRNHSGLDPDQQRSWWHSDSANPIGQQALNFGRIRDPLIDEALITIKSDPDPEVRRAAAEAINKQFGSQVYNLWLTWAVWGVIAQPYVNGVESNMLPDGIVGVGLQGQGRHQTNQIWCDEGNCE